MDPKTKKIVFIAVGSMFAIWFMMVGWLAIGFLGDMRYEQQVRRWHLDESERSRKRAEHERKERLSDLEEQARQRPKKQVVVGLSDVIGEGMKASREAAEKRRAASAK